MGFESRLQFHSETDVGVERSENQDNMGHFSPDETGAGWLFVVADGMGGAAGGRLASTMAVETIGARYAEILRAQGASVGVFEAISQALKDANKAVNDRSYSDSSVRGMGTTAVVLALLGDLVYTAHVGDSRIYRFRDGRLECLTRDHTRVQFLVDQGIITPAAGRKHPDGHIIVRNLGSKPEVEPDIPPDGPFRVREGDVFLLCSDGLYGLVSDESILKVLSVAPPEHASPALVKLANARGGHDNITVSILCAGEGPSTWSAYSAAALDDLIEELTSDELTDTALFDAFDEEALSPSDFETSELEAISAEKAELDRAVKAAKAATAAKAARNAESAPDSASAAPAEAPAPAPAPAAPAAVPEPPNTKPLLLVLALAVVVIVLGLGALALAYVVFGGEAEGEQSALDSAPGIARVACAATDGRAQARGDDVRAVARPDGIGMRRQAG